MSDPRKISITRASYEKFNDLQVVTGALRGQSDITACKYVNVFPCFDFKGNVLVNRRIQAFPFETIFTTRRVIFIPNNIHHGHPPLFKPPSLPTGPSPLHYLPTHNIQYIFFIYLL